MDWDELYRTGQNKAHWDSSHPSPELVGFVSSLEHINKWRVLDVGCGSGEDSIFLSNHAKEAFGVDVSPTDIEFAKSKSLIKGSNARFVVGSVFRLPFEDGAFHMITDRGCLHNIDSADWTMYVSEVYRVLREGGILFLRGARKVEEYGDGFTFIEPDSVSKVFADNRWAFAGPNSYTMYSDANIAILFSNLFVLRKL